jgi:hypothetical protein
VQVENSSLASAELGITVASTLVEFYHLTLGHTLKGFVDANANELGLKYGLAAVLVRIGQFDSSKENSRGGFPSLFD